MPNPKLIPKVIYGQRTDVKKNAYYVTDQLVIYPCGSALIFQDFTTNEQINVLLPDKTVHLERLLLSSRRNLIAAVVNAPDKALIHIYDAESQKRKRTLSMPQDATTKRFEALDFSFDERFVMAITGDPDWMMLAYNWERGKVETSTRANYITNPSAPVREVVCSLNDTSVVVIVGQGIFRLMTMQDNVWRQYGFQRADPFDITCCVFLERDRILCGTAEGLLLLIDMGELKLILEGTVITNFTAKAEKEEEPQGNTASAMVLERVQMVEEEGVRKDLNIVSLVALSNGFAFACGSLVHFFEKIAPNKYKKRNIYEITDKDYRENQSYNITNIRHIDVSPSENKMIATTGRSQIYEVKLWGMEMDIAGKVSFKHLGHSLHTGPIGDLALCYWKPIFLTCGSSDRTVRVWNYLTETLEMTKQYQEDVHSVSLHPTGLYAAIGFSDKLRFMIVLIDDLQVSREFPIRECPKSVFNVSGHLLAAVNRNIIQVFNITTFQNVTNLKGHSGLVQSLEFTQEDRKLVSCGTDGAIYEWDMSTYKRIGEVVNKGVSYSECATMFSAKYVYAVGSDRVLKEILNSNITRTFNLPEKDMNHVVIARSDNLMFLSGEKGWIMSIKMPIEDPPDCSVFSLHSSTVVQMKLTLDDKFLITCSKVGTMCIWRLVGVEGKIQEDFTYFDEILISRNDLDEKLSLVKDLTQRTFELEMEHAYQMRHTETVYRDKIKDIQETYNAAIEELKDTLEILEANHNTELNNINSDMNVMKERHEAEMLEVEAKCNSDLIIEYNKVVRLEELTDIVTKEYQKKLQKLKESKEKTIEELARINESKLYNLNRMVDEAREEITKEVTEHTEFTRQIEEDNDREIEDLKAKSEKLLKLTRESNMRMKGESGVLKKKIQSSQKEIEFIQMEIINVSADQEKIKLNIQILEQEILDLKKEISERDLRIQDKEKKIYDLKRRDQELERNKFVLNYRIKELKNQIEPRDREIKERKELITEMEVDLHELQKVNLSLDYQLTGMREKLSGVYKLLHQYKKKCTLTVKIIKRVKNDIYFTSGNIQDYKKLKDGVKQLYFKYITDKEFAKARQGDLECVAELQRQKNYLETITKSLESKLQTGKEATYGEDIIYMEMNWALMDEIYKIRKKLKLAQSKIVDMETLMCVRMSKTYSPREGHKIIHRALRSDEDVKEECEMKMNEASNIVIMLREEVDSVWKRINAIETTMTVASQKKRKTKETLKFDIPALI